MGSGVERSQTDPWPQADLVRPSPEPRVPPSAALDVLLDDHAAVSEERTGQRLQESPRVGAGVKSLHVAEGGALTAHDASCGEDLPVQDHSAAELSGVIHVGTGLDVSFVRVIDGGGSSVGSSQDENQTVQTHSGGTFVIYHG